MNPKGRHLARQYALQAIYQWQMTNASTLDIETEFLTHRTMNKKTDFPYFKELLHGIPNNQHELEQDMQPFLGRPLPEIDPIELAILQISVYELAKRLDVPYRVIINEALELTKKFGSIEGYKFVNGVLDNVAKKLRTIETTKSKK